VLRLPPRSFFGDPVLGVDGRQTGSPVHRIAVLFAFSVCCAIFEWFWVTFFSACAVLVGFWNRWAVSLRDLFWTDVSPPSVLFFSMVFPIRSCGGDSFPYLAVWDHQFLCVFPFARLRVVFPRGRFHLAFLVSLVIVFWVAREGVGVFSLGLVVRRCFLGNGTANPIKTAARSIFFVVMGWWFWGFVFAARFLRGPVRSKCLRS